MFTQYNNSFFVYKERYKKENIYSLEIIWGDEKRISQDDSIKDDNLIFIWGTAKSLNTILNLLLNLLPLRSSE